MSREEGGKQGSSHPQSLQKEPVPLGHLDLSSVSRFPTLGLQDMKRDKCVLLEFPLVNCYSSLSGEEGRGVGS